MQCMYSYVQIIIVGFVAILVEMARIFSRHNTLYKFLKIIKINYQYLFTVLLHVHNKGIGIIILL